MVRHKSKRKSKFKLFLVSLLVLTGVVYTCKSVIIPGGRHELYKNGGSKTTPAPSLTKTSKSSDSISSGILYSPNAILVRLSDQSVLMQKKSEEKIYPASLTKIMTTVVALESLPDLQQKITLQSSMFRELYKADAALAGFQPGEKVSAIDLIYGVMLPSGAECCMALANQIAGSAPATPNLADDGHRSAADMQRFLGAIGAARMSGDKVAVAKEECTKHPNPPFDAEQVSRVVTTRCMRMWGVGGWGDQCPGVRHVCVWWRGQGEGCGGTRG
jgi:hypothetical protein